MASELTDEEYGLLIRNGWHSVLAKGGFKTGLWAHPGLHGSWKPADAVELQKWRDEWLHSEPPPSVMAFPENELGEALLQKVNRKLPEEAREAYIVRAEAICDKWGPLVLHWCEEQRDEARTEVERLRAENADLRERLDGKTFAYPAGYDEALKVVEAGRHVIKSVKFGYVVDLVTAISDFDRATVGQAAGQGEEASGGR